MNQKLRRRSKKFAGEVIGLTVFIFVVASGFLAVDYIKFDTTDLADKQNHFHLTGTELKMSDHDERQSQLCQNQGINQSNASELKACVFNQTTG